MKVLLGTLLALSVLVGGLWANQSPISVSAPSFSAAEIIDPTVPCPPGFVPFNNECIRTVVGVHDTVNAVLQCQAGYVLTAAGRCAPNRGGCPHVYYNNGQSCAPANGMVPYPNAYEIAAISSCPTGYAMVAGGQCVKRASTVQVQKPLGAPACPPGYTPMGDKCRRELSTGFSGKQSSPVVARPGGNIIEIVRNRTITIISEIDIPINITNINNQTTYVDTNNGIITNLDASKGASGAAYLGPSKSDPEKCCEVVSPRICQKKDENEWRCFHRRTEECGTICTAPVVYLRRSDHGYSRGRMVIPPRPKNYLNGRRMSSAMRSNGKVY